MTNQPAKDPRIQAAQEARRRHGVKVKWQDDTLVFAGSGKPVPDVPTMPKAAADTSIARAQLLEDMDYAQQVCYFPWWVE